jgi:hypothetical protein
MSAPPILIESLTSRCYRSLGGESLEKNLYVAGLSVFGCIGRFSVASISDRLYALMVSLILNHQQLLASLGHVVVVMNTLG